MQNKRVSHYAEVESFITKDGSVIRELMHPQNHAVKAQSLAEARLASRQKTVLHLHRQTEEIYYIVSGTGLMTLGSQQFEVRQGDTICISPGTAHCLENMTTGELVILCSCSPAYRHDDTELLESLTA